MKYFNNVKPLFESDNLVKTYVPTFDEFSEDPDKWLEQLPNYGENNEFGSNDSTNDDLDSFESGDGEESLDNTSAGGDIFGDSGSDNNSGFEDTGESEPIDDPNYNQGSNDQNAQTAQAGAQQQPIQGQDQNTQNNGIGQATAL